MSPPLRLPGPGRMAVAALMALLVWAGLPRPVRAQEADSPAHRLLTEGLAARAQGQLDRAAALFETGLAHDSTSVPLWVELGVTRSWRSDLGGADAAFRAALVHDPRSAGARLGRARVAAWRGDLAAARDLYHPLLEDPVTRLGAINGLAATEAAALNRAAAQAWYRLALAEDPGNREALEGLERASRINRTEWRVGMTGSARGADRRWSFETAVTHQLQPGLSMLASYRAGAEESSLRGIQNQGGGDLRRWSHAGRLGVRWKPARELQLGTEVTVARSVNGWATFAGLEGSRSIAGPARLVIGLRPGWLPGEVGELLTWAGLTGVPVPVGRVEGQLFRAADTRGLRSTALAVWWSEQIGRAVAVRVGGIRGWSGDAGFTELRADWTVLRTPAGAVTAGLDWFRGAYHRTSFSLAVARGW